VSGPKSIGGRAATGLRATNRGRSALRLVLLLALVAVGCLTFWFASRTAPTPDEVHLPTDQSRSIPTSGRGSADSPPMAIQPALEVGRSEKQPRPVPEAFNEKNLDGRGHIRGFVQAPAGVEFPQEWVLNVLPSSALVGREHAETRRLEFHAGEQEFDLPELSLGGYMLRASAFGLASDEQHLLLAKPHETELYVVMQLSVTTFVEGNVRYEDYTPAVGLELALEPRPSGVRVTTKTDAIGHFLFTDVKSGGYTLHFGQPETPVRDAVEVNVTNSPERVPEAVVPKMGELIVRVLQESGAPAKGVKLDGYGEHGGRISGETNAEGEFRATFLPPGRITVNAIFPDGSTVKGRKSLDAGGLELLELIEHK
jgi:hypothetical protein